MRAIVTVLGKDRVGIMSAVCALLAQHNVNILDISQTILQDYFAMIMLVDLSAANMDFTAFSEQLSAIGTQLGVDIRCTRQELYDAMHKV